MMSHQPKIEGMMVGVVWVCGQSLPLHPIPTHQSCVGIEGLQDWHALSTCTLYTKENTGYDQGRIEPP